MQKLLYWLAPFYTLLIAYGSLSSNGLPRVSIANADKLYHAVGYFGMMLLWYLFFYHRFLERQLHFTYNLKTILSQWSLTIAVGAGLFSLAIGGLIELGQGYLVNNRNMDAYDMVANAVGIIIASLTLWVIAQTFNRR